MPDEVLAAVVVEALSSEAYQQQGWLLDGFPRTHAQATALVNGGHTPEVMVMLDVTDEVLLAKSSQVIHPHQLASAPPGTAWRAPDCARRSGSQLRNLAGGTDDSAIENIHRYHEQMEGAASVLIDRVRCGSSQRAPYHASYTDAQPLVAPLSRCARWKQTATPTTSSLTFSAT